MVIGVDRVLAAALPGQNLIGAARDHLIGVMFDWVPEPVCQMTSGNWSSWSPFATSPAACWIASAVRIEAADAGVDPGRRLLDEAERVDEISAGICSRGPNGKFLHRTLGLRPPISIRGNIDRPKLSVSLRCWSFSDPPPRPPLPFLGWP